MSTSTSTSQPPSITKPIISSIKTIDKILTTIHEMLTDRGYEVQPKAGWLKKNQQVEDLRAIGHSKRERETIFVYFATDIKVPVKKMREYIQHMEENKVEHAIIVYAQQITPGAKTELTKYNIETFQAKELFENRTRHYLVPRHEKVESEEEVQAIMKKYHAKSKNDFPIYYTSDIIVRYYNWKPGTIVRIYRNLGGLKEPEIYYRHVKVA